MDFRTTFNINPSPARITYKSQVMLIGSCFTSEIGAKLEEGKLNVIINPTGTTYNPVSIANSLDLVMKNRKYGTGNLHKFGNLNLSFLHDSKFSSWDLNNAIKKINSSTEMSHRFLRNADFLFVTFGTSRIYRFMSTGKIVSNCHKIPAEEFTRELLSVENIAELWQELLNNLLSFNNKIKVVFTVSPVRHWKDGAHGNQVSKAVLILAVERLLDHPAVVGYFPAYEMVMDDLRDYRYYADDMLHLSDQAVEYIWEKFSECYLDLAAAKTYNDVRSITMAMKHRFLTDSGQDRVVFAGNMLNKIGELEKRYPFLDFTMERERFESVISPEKNT